MKKLNYILVCGCLSIILILGGCKFNQGNEVITAPLSDNKEEISTKQGENNNATVYSFTNWNEKKLYDFLNEVLAYTHQVAMKTYLSKAEIITKYQSYFTPKLSEIIVNSLFVKTDDGWKVPDGDGGYIFTIPVKGEDEHSNVVIEIQEKFIKLKATYEIGMYSLIQYTIRYDNKPIITEWILQ